MSGKERNRCHKGERRGGRKDREQQVRCVCGRILRDDEDELCQTCIGQWDYQLEEERRYAEFRREQDCWDDYTPYDSDIDFSNFLADLEV